MARAATADNDSEVNSEDIPELEGLCFQDDSDDDKPKNKRFFAEEELSAEDELAKLVRNMYEVHPQMVDPRRLIPNYELETAIRAARHPSISLNAAMVMGGSIGGSRRKDTLGARVAPAVIAVTGHTGRGIAKPTACSPESKYEYLRAVHPGGNVGLNGIYELYPDAFCDRPVYQKTLEKQEVKSFKPTVTETQASSAQEYVPAALRAPRERVLHDKNSRLEANKAQRALIVRSDARGSSKMVSGSKHIPTHKMVPCRDPYFLFFDRGNGCWCIGPRVGHSEIFARCAATEELLPDHLDRWELWDVGLKVWCENDQMRTHKGSGPDRDSFS